MYFQALQPERREKREKSQLGGLRGRAVSPHSGVQGRAPEIFDFKISERLNMTIWMSEEESPDNIHTRFRQTSAATNAIFISRTLKLFWKKLRTRVMSISILFPAFWTNRSAWTNCFFQPRSQSVCFDRQTVKGKTSGINLARQKGFYCATDVESRYIWVTTIEWPTLTFKMTAMWKQKDRWIQKTKTFQQNYRKLRNNRWQSH